MKKFYSSLGPVLIILLLCLFLDVVFCFVGVSAQVSLPNQVGTVALVITQLIFLVTPAIGILYMLSGLHIFYTHKDEKEKEKEHGKQSLIRGVLVMACYFIYYMLISYIASLVAISINPL